MSRLMKKRSKKAGLPPGTLIHIGEPIAAGTEVRVLEYDEERFRQEKLEDLETCFLFPEKPAVTWIQVEGVHQPEVMEKLGQCFSLHPLMLEDILNTDQRPKVEDYGEDLFIVVKALSSKETGEIAAEQVSLVLKPNALLSFREGSGNLFGPLQERLRTGKGRVRKMGADYLAYSLLDVVVDQYFLVLEKLGEEIESLEAKVVAGPAMQTVGKIQELKREMILLRKWIWPLREVVNNLEREEEEQEKKPARIQETTRIYLRDVYDHTIQVLETIEIFREMLSGMMDIYLSSINNRMNAIMKVLTIIATIFMPLTFIAGVYGMNFKNMPELNWSWGYPGVLIGMLAIGVFMLLSFRKKKWL